MKKFTKVILGMMLAVMFGTILGSNPADASEQSVGDRYDGRRVVMRPWLNQDLVVDWSQTNTNAVILYQNNNSWNQSWRMSYQQDNDSYIFMAGGNHENGRAAFMTALNIRDFWGNRAVGTEITTLSAMKWRLHHLGRHERGDVYILENVAHGTVLDVFNRQGIIIRPSLILSQRHGSYSQRFIFQLLD